MRVNDSGAMKTLVYWWVKFQIQLSKRSVMLSYSVCRLSMLTRA